MIENGTLKPKQTAAAAALATGSTRLEAAAAAGVGLTTIARWLRRDDFRAAIRASQAAAVDQARRKLAGELERAVDVAVDIMTGGSADSTRLAAARSIWAFFETAAMADLDARVAALEDQQSGN